MAFSSHPGFRRWLPLLLAAGPVTVLAVGVEVTRSGIDILVIALACLALFAIERTVGDWLGELVGATVAGIVFAGVAFLAIWYFFFSSAGTKQTTDFFAAAEARGYRTAYLDTGADPNRDTRGTAASPDRGPAPNASAGSASSSAPAASSSTAASSSSAVSSEPSREPERRNDPERKAEAGTGAATSAKQPPSGTSVLKWFWNRSERPEPKPTAITLTVAPARIVAGQRTMLIATVTVGGQPVPAGTVQFMVGDLAAGTVTLRDGAAETTYSSFIAGSYTAHARFTGNAELAASVSGPVTVTVSPR